MEGIVQLGDCVLDDVLSFCDGALQQGKLLVQELLFQQFLLSGLRASKNKSFGNLDYSFKSPAHNIEPIQNLFSQWSNVS